MTKRTAIISIAVVALVILFVGCQRRMAAPGSSAPPSNAPTITYSATVSPVPKPTPSPDPVMEHIRQMTLPQKLGQMVMSGIEGIQLDEQAVQLMIERHVGGFILYKANLSTVEQAVALLNGLKSANPATQPPLFLSVDQEGGTVSRLPSPVTAPPASRQVGRKGDSNQALAVGSAIGTQLQAFGFNMDFAPVMDMDSNPANPVIGSRSFSSSAATVASLGIQEMLGIHSQGVIPVAKHFPGHGDTSVDSHLELPTVTKSLEQLRRLELIPFTAAIQSGSEAVMVAHILLPQLDPGHPASMSSAVITGLLREELGFRGVVITDDMTMGAIAKHYDLAEASLQSVLSGTDIVLVAHDYNKVALVLDALEQAALTGVLPIKRINESVYRILTLKKQYHLADTPVPRADVKEINSVMDKAAAGLNFTE